MTTPPRPGKITLSDAFATIDEAWAPRDGGRINDCQIRLAKFRGSFIWHSHETEDEMFLVIAGSMTMHFRDGSVSLGPGEYLIVPRGTEHRPETAEEAHVLMVEPASTVNTGTAGGDRTRAVQALETP
jgi:mannose-6-phosphate isomerase-like protein (cupin superfamily)